MSLQDAIVSGKDKLPDITPTPPGFHPQATANELKSRLNWGEPGLTILDVRDHAAFLEYRILGAMSMPLDQLPQSAEQALQRDRDIYVYGATEDETTRAAELLRQSGFQHIAELKGGLDAWKEIHGSVEGTGTATEPPSPGAYNIASRLKEFSEERAEEKAEDRTAK